MKFIKWATVVIGAIGAMVAGYYLFQSWVGVGKMMAVANANKSQGFPSPMDYIYLAAGIAFASGIVLGLGLGLPSRTQRSLRRELTATTAAPAHFADTTADDSVTEQPADEATPATEPANPADKPDQA